MKAISAISAVISAIVWAATTASRDLAPSNTSARPTSSKAAAVLGAIRLGYPVLRASRSSFSRNRMRSGPPSQSSR